MIKPFVDAMSRPPEGGHVLFQDGDNISATSSNNTTSEKCPHVIVFDDKNVICILIFIYFLIQCNQYAILHIDQGMNSWTMEQCLIQSKQVSIT